MKVDPLNLESQNQAKNIPVSLPRSPIKIWGFWELGSDKQTDRQQTEIKTLLQLKVLINN